MDVALVRSTYPSEGEAWEAAQAAVGPGLAACVHVVPIRSCYVWQGRREEGQEWSLEARCLRQVAPHVAALLREGHPYEVPLVEVLSSAVDEAYAAWMVEVTLAPDQARLGAP